MIGFAVKPIMKWSTVTIQLKYNNDRIFHNKIK